MQLDVIVHSSDLAGVLVWRSLRLRGFKALLVTESMRLSNKLLNLPITSTWGDWIAGLGEVEPPRTEKVFIRLSEAPYASFYPPARVGIIDARRVAESIASCDGEWLEVWCRGVELKVKDGRVSWTIHRRLGHDLSGTAHLLVETGEPGRGGGGYSTILTTPRREGRAIIEFSDASLRLHVSHGSLSTIVEAPGRLNVEGAVSIAHVQSGMRVDVGDIPLINAGLRSGLVAPPWIGDYLAATAELAYVTCHNWLEGRGLRQKILEQLAELAARKRLVEQVIEEGVRGGVGELKVNFILEALKPPQPINYKP